MKRIIPIFLSLFLAITLCLPICAVPLSLSETFYADGKDTILPESASGNGVLVGWTAEVNDSVILLAPGEKYTSDTEVLFEPVFVRFSLYSGASVRYVSPVGLRFTTRVDESDYQKLSEMTDDFSFGTLVSVEDMINGSFTKEAIENDGGTALEIPAKVWMSQNSNERTYSGVIANIKESNYGRRFCARPYVNISYTNGEKRTVYGDFDSESNARSVAYVSSCAVNDESNTLSAEQKATLSSFFELKEISINLTTPTLGATVEDAYAVKTTNNYTVFTGWECQFLGKKPEIFLDEYAYRSLVIVTPAEGMVITENTEIIFNGASLKDENGAFIKKADSLENNKLFILRTYERFGVSWAYGSKPEAVCGSCEKTLHINTLSICPYCDNNLADNINK